MVEKYRVGHKLLRVRAVIIFLSFVITLATSVVYCGTQSFVSIFDRGEAFFAAGKYSRALPFLSAAFRMNPHHGMAGWYLAWACEKMGMPEDSFRVLEQLRAHNYTDLSVIELLADSYYSLSRFERAEELYRQIVAVNPNGDLVRKLVQVLAWQKKYTEGMEFADRQALKNPADLSIVEASADAHCWAKDYDSAIKQYNRLLTLGHNRQKVLLKLAEALRFSGRKKEALAAYEQYLGGTKKHVSKFRRR